MKLIDRYVTQQIVVAGAFAVVVLSVVLVLGNIFKRLLDLLVNHDVPLAYILSFVGYVLPFSLTFTIPWGFLTAVLLVFGKMSAENELTALRSNGISITRICAPLMVLALVASAICLWINLDVAPRAQERMKNMLFEIATNNPIALFGSDQVIEEFPNRKIYVGHKDGNELHNIIVYEMDKRSQPIRVVHARKGELSTDLENQQVLLRLYDARFEQRDEQNPRDLMKIRQGITMQEGVLPISLSELFEKNKKRRGLSQMTLKELLNDAPAKKRLAARTEVNKRFSFALATVAFALIGVPLAVTAHRRETSIGFLLSLIVAFVYFFFIIVADMVRDKPGAYPELLIWLPNVLFIGLGILLFRRLSRR